MGDIKIFKQSDLILDVNQNFNPEVLNLDEWEWFLDVLCGNRDYQKEAIKNAIIFMASEEYTNIEDLVLDNYKRKPELQLRYPKVEDYLNSLQIRDKLHANIDLATGTGKSYVIYGIAQIMLGLGLVKRVLVLCPSTTIEKGLKDKFNDLTSMEELRESIPESAKIKYPRIIDANQTINEGDICVENIHAVYENTGSSIDDSFKNGGSDTLVLNDESHHIYNDLQSISGRTKEGQNIKKWKEFLLEESSDFKYIIGLTGTAYINNEYYNDVIYRYSLREAIDDKIVKSIDYVQKDDSGNNLYEKFQKIYQNHNENIKRNSTLKPLTILITKDINKAKGLKEDLIDFLVKWEERTIEEIEKKVLIVTSDSDHASNIVELDYVDDKSNSVEWIISVSMLTEGWDVKNVFQIVPWEDRAFNSKLLISQVLGRGLRIPEGYEGKQPSVIVFNHDSWSKNIKSLVDEVLEIETRIISSVKFDGQRNKHNFTVHNIPYTKEEKEIEHDEELKPLDYSKTWRDGIKLVSQTDKIRRETSYQNLVSGKSTSREYDIEYLTEDLDIVVNKILHEFRMRDWEGGILGLGDEEVYSRKNLPPRDKIEEIIRKSMTNVGIEGDSLTKENANRVFRAFSTLFRSSSKTVIQKSKSSTPYELDTKDMNNESIGLSSLRTRSTVFYADDYEDVSVNEEQRGIFKKFLNDKSFPRSSSTGKNSYLFKTPQNYVFTTESPEYNFVYELCKKENAKHIESWIKSRDQGFYSIEYSYRIGNHQRQRSFNPDFFIKCKKGKEVIYLVVEIKSDRDISIENKAKYKYGKLHFEELNNKLKIIGKNEKYIFHFLSPDGYPAFFKYLEEGKIFENQEVFRCDLENLLEE